MREKDEFHAVRIHLQFEFEIANKSHFKLFQSNIVKHCEHCDAMIVINCLFHELVKLWRFSADKIALTWLNLKAKCFMQSEELSQMLHGFVLIIGFPLFHKAVILS